MPGLSRWSLSNLSEKPTKDFRMLHEYMNTRQMVFSFLQTPLSWIEVYAKWRKPLLEMRGCRRRWKNIRHKGWLLGMESRRWKGALAVIVRAGLPYWRLTPRKWLHNKNARRYYSWMVRRKREIPLENDAPVPIHVNRIGNREASLLLLQPSVSHSSYIYSKDLSNCSQKMIFATYSPTYILSIL